ncbi:MAG: hypothetical protein WC718_08030 [Phycisphaerales bacterium]|jgi:hypothetical protein
MTTDAPTILLDPEASPALLRRAGVELALDKDEAAHAPLRAALGDAEFLNRLDPPAALRGGGRSMGLARIITALHDSDFAAARATLAGLASDDMYLSQWRRENLLIEATDVLRPPAQNVVKLWEHECTPEGIHTITVIRACLHNGSPAAMTLLTQRWLDPRFEPARKQFWDRQYVVEVRADEAVLAWAAALLDHDIPEAVALDLAQVIFDFQESWYGTQGAPAAAKYENTTDTARDALKQLAELVLTRFSPGADLRFAISRTKALVDSKN